MIRAEEDYADAAGDLIRSASLRAMGLSRSLGVADACNQWTRLSPASVFLSRATQSEQPD